MTTYTPTLLEALFIRKLGRPVREGSVIQLPVDVIMAHDATMALMLDDFTRLGCRIRHPEQVLVACDHFCPPARIDWADLQRAVIDFATQQHFDLRMYQGICHQLLLEDSRVVPGNIVIGADSHTVTAGAVGSFATGLGATDILAALATGETWFRVPHSIRIRFQGSRQPWVSGRDLALYLLGQFGEDGAAYHALELWDETDDHLSMDSRAAISCMATEMGAKAALFVPDAITHDYLQARDGYVDQDSFALAPAASDAVHNVDAMILDIDVSRIDNLLARPHSPANIDTVPAAAGTSLHQIYIGSCASGRLEDLAVVARILEGRAVAPGLKVIVVPSSVRIMQEALRRGYIQRLLDAGVCVSNPSCGACGGLDKGVLASGERALMTSTRNFQGRLGPRDSEVFLASAATCAASALTGQITHPADVWQ